MSDAQLDRELDGSGVRSRAGARRRARGPREARAQRRAGRAKEMQRRARPLAASRAAGAIRWSCGSRQRSSAPSRRGAWCTRSRIPTPPCPRPTPPALVGSRAPGAVAGGPRGRVGPAQAGVRGVCWGAVGRVPRRIRRRSEARPGGRSLARSADGAAGGAASARGRRWTGGRQRPEVVPALRVSPIARCTWAA